MVVAAATGLFPGFGCKMALSVRASVGSELSQNRLATYLTEGYLLVRGVFSEQKLRVWESRFVDLVERRIAMPAKVRLMRDVMVAKGGVPASGTRPVVKIQDLEEDEILFTYSRDEVLLDLVESLIGRDITSVHTMFLNKPPGVDGRHPLHQDQVYFPFGPPDLIVGAWTAIDSCNRQNGCLSVVPGSHRLGLLSHETPPWDFVNDKYWGVVRHDEFLERSVHLEMDGGDVVLFHPLLIHGSGTNGTSGFRRAISTHFASSDCNLTAEGHPLGLRNYVRVRGRSRL
jgi:phytanoyl-CoA hydroxylase